MESNGYEKIRFGKFDLDPTKRIVWHGDDPVELPLKAVDLLCLLVERRGDVVTKDEIWTRVWNDAFLEETNLTHNIYLLRKAFRQYGSGDLIKTVPRRGYRFVGEVSPSNGHNIVYERATITDTFIEEVTTSDEKQTTQLWRARILLAAGVAAVVLIGTGVWFSRPAARGSILENHTQSIDAYRLYERGRFEWNKRNASGMLEAERLFRAAIVKDPNFALAYSGLADTIATASRWDEASAAAARALELAPDLAEAHASDGFVKMFGLQQWDAAEDAFRRAIEIDPNYATAYHWYAVLLSIRGRNDQAKIEIQKALDINPLSPNYLTTMGQLHYYAGEHEAAREYCGRALGLDPNFLFAHECLYYIGLKTGNHEQAVESLIKAELSMKEDATSPAQVKADEALAEGYRESLQKGSLAGFLHSKYPDTSDPDAFYFIAMKYALLGDRDKAIFYLDKAADTRTFLSAFARANPLFEPLRSDPRYQAVLTKMNLAD